MDFFKPTPPLVTYNELMSDDAYNIAQEANALLAEQSKKIGLWRIIGVAAGGLFFLSLVGLIVSRMRKSSSK